MILVNVVVFRIVGPHTGRTTQHQVIDHAVLDLCCCHARGTRAIGMADEGHVRIARAIVTRRLHTVHETSQTV